MACPRILRFAPIASAAEAYLLKQFLSMLTVRPLWTLVRSGGLRLNELFLQPFNAVDLLLLIAGMLLRLHRIVVHIHVLFLTILNQIAMPLIQLVYFTLITFGNFWLFRILSLFWLSTRTNFLQSFKIQISRLLLTIWPLAIAIFILIRVLIKSRLTPNISLTFLQVTHFCLLSWNFGTWIQRINCRLRFILNSWPIWFEWCPIPIRFTTTIMPTHFVTLRLFTLVQRWLASRRFVAHLWRLDNRLTEWPLLYRLNL